MISTNLRKSIVLLILILLLIPIASIHGQKFLTWHDPLEVPQLPRLDVKEMAVSWQGNITLIFSFYRELEKNISIIGNIYFDKLIEGEGVPSGDTKGADYRLIFLISPERKVCIINRYDSLRNEWDITMSIKCKAKIEEGKVIVKTPNLTKAFPKKEFGVKAYIWTSEKDDFGWVNYKIHRDGKAIIDGKLGDYTAPIILDPVGDADQLADYKALYAKDDFYHLYFAIVPVDGLGCKLRGYGARLERFFGVYIDADLNRSNGFELASEYIYRCSMKGREWERIPLSSTYINNPRLRREGVMIDKVFESYVYLGPILNEIAKNKEFGLKATIITRVMDRVPDNGWIIYSNQGIYPKEFEVTGPQTDLAMNSDISELFKSFGKVSGTNRIVLGGPAVNPSYGASVKFLKSSRGYYSGIEVNGTDYWVSYGSSDYAVVSISNVGGGTYIIAAGVTRYGTRAALLWLSENMHLLRGGTYVLSWIDNGNGKVELSEIGVISANEGS